MFCFVFARYFLSLIWLQQKIASHALLALNSVRNIFFKYEATLCLYMWICPKATKPLSLSLCTHSPIVLHHQISSHKHKRSTRPRESAHVKCFNMWIAFSCICFVCCPHHFFVNFFVLFLIFFVQLKNASKFWWNLLFLNKKYLKEIFLNLCKMMFFRCCKKQQYFF
jgi:hypothetical protein